MRAFLRLLPKAELHLHLEGTASGEGEKRHFGSLDAFLAAYYAAVARLQSEEDFYRLALSYYEHVARSQGVVRLEAFFDPQIHLERGVAWPTFMAVLKRAADAVEHVMSVSLILCIVRHLPVENAEKMWAESEPYRHSHFVGIGLDSSEKDYPPELFADIFTQVRDAGMHRVAHAGEEGPAAFVWSCIDQLHVERIDHGIRSVEDEALVKRLAELQIPLTVCPLSNLVLAATPSLNDHDFPLRKLMEAGVCVTLNSDDPAYFGGHLLDNYLAIKCSVEEAIELAKNSIRSSFTSAEEKDTWIAQIGNIEHGAQSWQTLSKSRPLVIAHRGAQAFLPEETLEATALALEMGCDYVECDLVLTRDGRVILRHSVVLDDDTDVADKFPSSRMQSRTVDGKEISGYFACDFSLKEIQTLRARQSRPFRDLTNDGKFGIATLEEMVQLTQKSGAKLYCELKHGLFHQHVFGGKEEEFALEMAVVGILQEYFGESLEDAPIVIESFELASLQFVKWQTRARTALLFNYTQVNDDGSLETPGPYDLVAAGDKRTFSNLSTRDGMLELKEMGYVDILGPGKPFLLQYVQSKLPTHHTSESSRKASRIVAGSTGFIERAHLLGFEVHAWTFREDSHFGWPADRDSRVEECAYFMLMGLDGLFVDDPSIANDAIKSIEEMRKRES